MAVCASPSRLSLQQVTLCAVSSVNVAATVNALETCLHHVDFADCLLFTDVPVAAIDDRITLIPIHRLTSAEAYSSYVLRHIADHIATSHALIVQWDGHVLDPKRWQPQFLDYDYIGAAWPQFTDGHDVGNGGFSLRSRRLLAACQAPDFCAFHPEDVAIGRHNRAWLERQGIRFAPQALANQFSTERAGNLATSFGYHGVWHMPRALGMDRFWEIYCGLDERSSLRPDFAALVRAVWRGPSGHARALRMIANRVADAIR